MASGDSGGGGGAQAPATARERRSSEYSRAAGRTVRLNDAAGTAEGDGKKYKNNRVRTAKYTVINFLPKSLYEQFRRIANAYFLVVAFLSLTPYSPVMPMTTFGPLAFVVGVSILKEAKEDWDRAKEDKRQNSTGTRVLRGSEFVPVEWLDVRAGDILKVERDEFFPADLLLLCSSTKDGVCYVETKNLDGETNLKARQVVEEVHKQGEGAVPSLEGTVECEAPNNNLYTFTGNLNLPGHDKISLDPSQVLLRGSVLRNTKEIIGVVVFAGHDTKVMMNATEAPSKRSMIDRRLDMIVIFMLGWLSSLCGVHAIVYGEWTRKVMPDHWYLMPWDTTEEYDPDRAGLSGTVNLITAFILLGYLIPISLYVTLEMVKVSQMLILNCDRHMYHKETDTPFLARTSNLNEELGIIDTVLSDKTGTLTQNTMEFFKCSVAGVKYGRGVTEIERAVAAQKGVTLQEPAGADEGPQEPGFNFRDERLDGGAWVKTAHPSVAANFFRCLAVCHSVLPEGETEPDKISYQCESPDEAAFVVAAKRFGFFFHTRTQTSVTVREALEPGKAPTEATYEVLAQLEFSSARKRMSTICRFPDGRIVLFCKGADAMVLERLANTDEANRFTRATQEHMEQDAQAGLRTLCLAMVELQPKEFEAWHKKYVEAKTALQDRDKKLEAVGELIEKNLTLLGSTSIEDKLQEGVPATIAALAAGGIKIWVLTGDKQDTAINIAMACNMLRPGMEQFIINLDNLAEAAKAAGDSNIVSSEWKQKAFDSVKQQLNAAKTKRQTMKGEAAVVIDGRSLSHALKEELCDLLLELCTACESVVCCRVSPIQKAQVTALVKQSGRTTLGIGDGANDVGMIQAAHVGVGISGQEGMQAVMASDFAIAQFRFLERMLIVHGRWNYKRIARMIVYFFYKNVLFGMTMFYYSCAAAASGTLIFNDMLMAAYNVFFVFLPILIVGVFDQDIPAHVALACPFLYRSGTRGPNGEFFDVGTRAAFLANGVYQSLIIFLFTVLGSYSYRATMENGKVAGLHETGTATYTALVIVVNLQVGQILNYWNWITHLSIWGSILFWFLVIIVYSEGIEPSVSTNQYKLIISDVFPNPTYWLNILPVVALSLMPDFLYRCIQRQFFPREYQLVQELYRTKGTPLHALVTGDWQAGDAEKGVARPRQHFFHSVAEAAGAGTPPRPPPSSESKKLEAHAVSESFQSTTPPQSPVPRLSESAVAVESASNIPQVSVKDVKVGAMTPPRGTPPRDTPPRGTPPRGTPPRGEGLSTTDNPVYAGSSGSTPPKPVQTTAEEDFQDAEEAYATPRADFGIRSKKY